MGFVRRHTSKTEARLFHTHSNVFTCCERLAIRYENGQNKISKQTTSCDLKRVVRFVLRAASFGCQQYTAGNKAYYAALILADRANRSVHFFFFYKFLLLYGLVHHQLWSKHNSKMRIQTPIHSNITIYDRLRVKK